MARGLSDLQKKILTIINDEGGGYLTEINKKIKFRLYPDQFYESGGAKRLVKWRNGGYSRYENGNWINDNNAYNKQCNQFLKIRVTISNSIAGLVRRGLITKINGFDSKEYRFTYIYITDTGREVALSINDPRNDIKLSINEKFIIGLIY